VVQHRAYPYYKISTAKYPTTAAPPMQQIPV
jgi:hypothetical protein